MEKTETHCDLAQKMVNLFFLPSQKKVFHTFFEFVSFLIKKNQQYSLNLTFFAD